MEESWIQVNMCARHLRAREATSSESESRGTSPPPATLPAATAPSSLWLANCRRAEEEEDEADEDDLAAAAAGRWSCSGEVVNIPDEAAEGRPFGNEIQSA